MNDEIEYFHVEWSAPGYGWQHYCTYGSESEARVRCKELKANDRDGAFRVVRADF